MSKINEDEDICVKDCDEYHASPPGMPVQNLSSVRAIQLRLTIVCEDNPDSPAQLA
jgi:hypothetical protein